MTCLDPIWNWAQHSVVLAGSHVNEPLCGGTVQRGVQALPPTPDWPADEPRDLDRAWDLARRHDAHRIYDMVYVALAERRRTQLITADAALRQLLGVDWIVAPEMLLR